jgi:hypothetical protein
MHIADTISSGQQNEDGQLSTRAALSVFDQNLTAVLLNPGVSRRAAFLEKAQHNKPSLSEKLVDLASKSVLTLPKNRAAGKGVSSIEGCRIGFVCDVRLWYTVAI